MNPDDFVDAQKYRRSAFCIMWDKDVEVWWLTSNHVPGLVIEGKQLQDLLNDIIPMWAKLAELNGTEPPLSTRSAPNEPDSTNPAVVAPAIRTLAP